MSTKGMSVTAARHLIEKLSNAGVTIFVIRDFDKAGFSIVHTMSHDTRRWKYKTPPHIIDLGLRLEDVRAMGLQSEYVDYKSNVDPRGNLRASGATEEECDFLVRGRDWGNRKWHGERVELNAMTSPQLISWLEAKLTAHGVTKVVPEAKTLENVYRYQMLQCQLQRAIDAVAAALPDPQSIPVPKALEEQVRQKITHTARAWDSGLWEIVSDKDTEDRRTSGAWQK
jgi:hypothetical protein